MGEIIKHPLPRGRMTAPARLTVSHDVNQFDCGKATLNDWLKTKALDSEGQSARTYVVCSGNCVVGYYCIATGSVERKALPSKLRKKQGLPNQFPVAIIGRLARQLGDEWRGLGLDLLQDALRRIAIASEIIGVRCVLVHAIDDEAAAFWRKSEFQEYPDGSRTFFMAMETVIDALA